MNWNGDNWTIQNIAWLVDERCTLSAQNVSWNTGDLNGITWFMKLMSTSQ